MPLLLVVLFIFCLSYTLKSPYLFLSSDKIALLTLSIVLALKYCFSNQRSLFFFIKTRELIFPLVVLLLYILSSSVSIFIHAQSINDSNFLLILLAYSLAVPFFLTYLKIIRFPLAKLSDAILLAGLLQSAFIYLYFLSPQYRQLLALILPLDDNAYSANTFIFRSRGLYNSFSSTLSLLQAYTFIVGLFRCQSTNLSYLQRNIRLLLLAFIGLSTFFTGRTGLIACLFAILLCFLQKIIILFNAKRINVSQSKSILYTLVILFTIVLTTGSVFVSNIDVSLQTSYGQAAIEKTSAWALGILDTSDNGIYSKLVSEHLKFPSGLGFIIGDISTWVTNRIQSDIGYVRTIYAFGFLAALSFYIALFLPNILLLSSLPRAYYSTSAEPWLLLSVTLVAFFAEFKEPYLTRAPIVFLFLLISFSIHSVLRPSNARA